MAADGGVLSIVGDDLRDYHPAYRRLMKADDKTAAFYTDRDSARWIEMLIAYAREQRFHALIESTMRVPDKICETANEFRARGYFVEARALAVDARWSTLGIHQRYEAMLAVHGHARFTVQKSHDAAYVGMLETLARIETDVLVDRIAIYRRGNVVIYANELAGVEWRHPVGARAAVEAERARPWSVAEALAYARAWKRIVQQRRGRGAGREDLRLARAARASAWLAIHMAPAAKAALAAQLETTRFVRTERYAAAAAFVRWPRQRACQLFPALHPYFEALERGGPSQQARRELVRQIERVYPERPARALSRRRARERDPGLDR
jgi:hypothetical protein